MDDTFIRGYKPYTHICQASLKEFFTKTFDEVYPKLVRELYIKLVVVGKPLITLLKE